MIEVKNYLCDYGKAPTDGEIRQACTIAKKYECAVKLEWMTEYSGGYHRYIYPNTDADTLIKDIRSIVYGL